MKDCGKLRLHGILMSADQAGGSSMTGASNAANSAGSMTGTPRDSALVCLDEPGSPQTTSDVERETEFDAVPPANSMSSFI